MGYSERFSGFSGRCRRFQGFNEFLGSLRDRPSRLRGFLGMKHAVSSVLRGISAMISWILKKGSRGVWRCFRVGSRSFMWNIGRWIYRVSGGFRKFVGSISSVTVRLVGCSERFLGFLGGCRRFQGLFETFQRSSGTSEGFRGCSREKHEVSSVLWDVSRYCSEDFRGHSRPFNNSAQK